MSQLTTCENRMSGAGRLEYVIPAVNLHYDADGFTLEVEMPGVRKEGVEITFDDGKLTLAGHRAASSKTANAVYAESVGQGYRRVFDIDSAVDSRTIQATMEQGLLTVRLAKAETSKPRKIPVS